MRAETATRTSLKRSASSLDGSSAADAIPIVADEHEAVAAGAVSVPVVASAAAEAAVVGAIDIAPIVTAVTLAPKRRKTMVMDIYNTVYPQAEEEAAAIPVVVPELTRWRQRDRAKIDPLTFWRNPKTAIDFPVLRRLARRLLAVQGSSVSSERLFSHAGNIITKKRCSLTAENARALIICNENKRLRSTQAELVPDDEGPFRDDERALSDEVLEFVQQFAEDEM